MKNKNKPEKTREEIKKNKKERKTKNPKRTGKNNTVTEQNLKHLDRNPTNKKQPKKWVA